MKTGRAGSTKFIPSEFGVNRQGKSCRFQQMNGSMRRGGVCPNSGDENMTSFLSTFLADESGASAAEYALILAVVGVAIGAAALVLGQNVGLSIKNAAQTVGKCGSKANTTGGASTYTTTVAGTECG